MHVGYLSFLRVESGPLILLAVGHRYGGLDARRRTTAGRGGQERPVRGAHRRQRRSGLQPEPDDRGEPRSRTDRLVTTGEDKVADVATRDRRLGVPHESVRGIDSRLGSGVCTELGADIGGGGSQTALTRGDA